MSKSPFNTFGKSKSDHHQLVGFLMKVCYTELNAEVINERIRHLKNIMQNCTLCPHECRVQRFKGKYGVCRISNKVYISSAGPHYGEELPLVGTYGSGTIFFSSCNLKCQFCQNYEISQLRSGRPVTIFQLAEIMLMLQQSGCHNINLVTPTHVIPYIVEAISRARELGLQIPLVYNCGGYESFSTLQLLDGIVDIYMPDIKYSDNEIARRYSGALQYWDIVRIAVKEMYRQVGNLTVNGQGIATRGLLIRHLVLPNRLAGSEKVLEFITKELSVDSYVNIMDQYHPVYHAKNHQILNRPIKKNEYNEVIKMAESIGLHRGYAS